MTMLKNGQAHTESLRDGRAVYIDGRLVEDVTVDPAFRNAVGSIAALYEFQSCPEHAGLMTFALDDGNRANRIWQLPHNYAELVERRRALEAWAEIHAGFIGRGPDHVASCIAAMFMGREVFEAVDPRRAAAISEYYRFARDNDVYLTYALINPQADRSKSAGEQGSEFLSAGVVDRDARGITIRGAKMLATGAPLANEIFVTCIQPLKAGEEKYAVSFVIPLAAPGLKILSRKSYEASATSTFDNPLAGRFDENDAVVYFDDVLVPWERVFADANIELCQRQFHATPAHVYQNYQSMVRLTVKLRFMLGIARRIAETNGILSLPPVREILGQLAAETAMVDALVIAMEAKGTMHGAYFVPDKHTLYAAQVLTQQLYPKVAHTLRELAGGGMIALPSSYRDFASPEIAEMIDATQQSPLSGAHDKVKFYKLAWDAVGSEFGSRHTQYEMFYAGATFVTKAHSFRTYDWDRATGLVDAMLDGYDLPVDPPAKPLAEVPEGPLAAAR
jgi:4-hydroxyphenylacetate 3-monooxygenase